MLCFSELFFVIKWCFLCGFIECVPILVRFALHCYKLKVSDMTTGHYKEYVEEKEHCEVERHEHRAHGRAHGPRWKVNPIPLHLHLHVDFPTFTTWLEDHVKQQLHVGLVEVSKKLVQLSHPPSHKAYTYDSTWPYGNHYQVDHYQRMDIHHMPHTILGWHAYSFKQAVDQLETKNNNCIFTRCGSVEGDYCGELFGTLISFVQFFWILINVCGNKRMVDKMKMDFGWSISNVDSHPWWNPMCSLCMCSCITKPLLICNFGRHLSNNIRKNLGPNR
jgi:hypothetical protein